MENTIYSKQMDNLSLHGLCGQTDRVTKIRVREKRCHRMKNLQEGV